MYITRPEIKNILNSDYRYIEAYEKAISLMRNNIGEIIDLDSELKKTGETRDAFILSITYNLIGYYMSSLGVEIDGSLHLKRANDSMQKLIDSYKTTLGNLDKYFVYEQNLPSDIWIITHDMGKHPSVTVVDSANSIVSGHVEYLSINELKITFNAAFSGQAYLN